jgi:Flp pilus assembly protein CpaB
MAISFTPLLRAFRRYRRIIAAGFVGLSVLTALTALSDSRGEVDVVVARRTVAPGAELSAADLALARAPTHLVPEGALTAVADAVGRSSVVPLPRGGILTALLTPSGLVAEGNLALPVQFADSAPLGLLRVGDRIDLLGAGTDGATHVVAERALVLALPTPDDAGWAGTDDASVLVELTPQQAAAVVEAATVSEVNFALR